MRCVWFLTFSLACAYDDQSLMQQGLGVEAGSRKAGYARALEQLTEFNTHVQSLGMDWDRQFVLQTVIQDAAVAQPSAASFVSLLAYITPILDELQAFKAQDDAEISGLRDVVNSHHATASADVASDVDGYYNNFTLKLDQHKACRLEEATAFNESSWACYQFTSSLATLNGPLNCDLPAAVLAVTDYDSAVDASAVMDAWIDFIQLLINFDTATDSNNVVTKADTCKTKTAHLEYKIWSCDELQRAELREYCQWKSWANTRCTSQETDYQSNYDTWLNRLGELQTRSTARVAVASAVDHIACLLAELANNTNEPQLANCQIDVTSATSYDFAQSWNGLGRASYNTTPYELYYEDPLAAIYCGASQDINGETVVLATEPNTASYTTDYYPSADFPYAYAPAVIAPVIPADQRGACATILP